MAQTYFRVGTAKWIWPFLLLLLTACSSSKPDIARYNLHFQHILPSIRAHLSKSG